ncbi:UDP-rhamnose/UDP-galactose transporter 2 [Citrus clementina]|uniref:UDP-rhamnose/UDP-galactose transporter 2 n=1 Tax=Citrus clementina TaxID=85681 RepID=UPI000CED3C88|nr:UDP-rhamnose/UDP-galactose transporter 2 [Citrus x clementina]
MAAEFVALASCCKEAEWLRNLLIEIPIWPKPMPPVSIHCDSETTLSRAYSQIYNGKSSYRDILDNSTYVSVEGGAASYITWLEQYIVSWQACNIQEYSVFSTTLQQISIGSLQKKYSVGSFELLSKTAPIQAVSLLVFGPFIDYYLSGKLLSNYRFSSSAFLFILLSCSLAVFCNVSQYLCIGRFSAVTFQVLGHMKTVCILTLGWLLFDSQLTVKNILGMTVAVLGMIVYSWAVEAEKRKPDSKTISHTKNNLLEEHVELLKQRIEESPAKDVELGHAK